MRSVHAHCLCNGHRIDGNRRGTAVVPATFSNSYCHTIAKERFILHVVMRGKRMVWGTAFAACVCKWHQILWQVTKS
uniref:Uncharacterized protein n=1 Tax=Anopheles coluzzii TaxID=1518534 RepID=A0A6E8WD91_ANOCL